MIYIIKGLVSFMKNLLFKFIILIFALFSVSAKFQNYKTERTKIAEGVILEKKIAINTGKTISEEFKILLEGNYWDAQFKDGKWGLSPMGQMAWDEYKASGSSGGGGGGCN